MFVIELVNGQEITEARGDMLSMNHNTGVVTVSRVDGNEESATHYSPTAWAQVKQRVQRSMVPASPTPMRGQVVQFPSR
jgi:hypothetical protein